MGPWVDASVAGASDATWTGSLGCQIGTLSKALSGRSLDLVEGIRLPHQCVPRCSKVFALIKALLTNRSWHIALARRAVVPSSSSELLLGHRVPVLRHGQLLKRLQAWELKLSFFRYFCRFVQPKTLCRDTTHLVAGNSPIDAGLDWVINSQLSPILHHYAYKSHERLRHF